MQFRIVHPLSIILPCLALSYVPALGASDDGAGIVHRLQQFDESRFDHLRWQITTEAEQRDGEQWLTVDRFEADVYLDGERYDVSLRQQSLREADPRVVLDARTIWDGSQYTHRQGPTADEVSSAHFTSNDARSGGEIGPGYVWGGLLRGTTLGDFAQIFRILDEAGEVDTVEPERLRGLEVHRISAHSPHGSYDVWVDVEHGIVHRIEYQKLEGDLYRGNALPFGIPDHEQSISSAEGHLDIYYGAVDGNFVPTEAIAYDRVEMADGTVDEMRYVSRTEHIEFEPEFEIAGAFQMDGIPDGMVVRNRDAPGLRYVWTRGEPVLDVGDDVIREMDGMLQGGAAGANESAGEEGANADRGEAGPEPASSSTQAILQPMTWVAIIALLMFVTGIVAVLIVRSSKAKVTR